MIRRTFLTLVLCVLFAPAFSFAQADNSGNGGGNGGGNGNANNGGGNGGGRGNFDPAQFRQRMEDRLKDELGAKDDEWKVIQPKLDKVMDLQFSSMRGMGGGRFGGRGGRDRNNDNSNTNNNTQQSDNPVAQAMQALRETLDNKDASADDINQKLTALRDARDKAKKELADAQKDLKDVLTPRQEAVLVMHGMLD